MDEYSGIYAEKTVQEMKVLLESLTTCLETFEVLLRDLVNRTYRSCSRLTFVRWDTKSEQLMAKASSQVMRMTMMKKGMRLSR